MAESYEEIVEGETLVRRPPGRRHEAICDRLHQQLSLALNASGTSRLLSPRSIVQLSPGTMVRPDITLVTTATRKPWLLAEIIDSDDHRVDTVIKKQLYEDLNVPRLWMIDPRYDNVEVYHGTPHGLALQRILTGREILQESLLPGLQLPIAGIFSA